MKATRLFVAGALATGALLSGIHAAATTAATTIAASFATGETARHSRSVEFAARIRQASDRYRLEARERRFTLTRKQGHELGSHRRKLEAIQGNGEGEVGQAHR